MFFLGIDVGTQGARAVAIGEDGAILAAASHPFAESVTTRDESGRFEQDPAGWREAVQIVCRQVTGRARDAAGNAEVGAVGVASTSGTLVPVGADGRPLGPAIMYSDARGSEEAEFLNTIGREYCAKVGGKFSSSSSLAKAVWWYKRRGGKDLRWFLSPADWLSAQLTGRFGVTDFTNALKMGYDVVDLCWPDFALREAGLPPEALPEVVRPGSVIGAVAEEASSLTGLPAGTPVIAGLTDGCASQFAAGAVSPGDWSSTLGTTLVVKGVTRALLRDPEGRVYCHRHPVSGWLPGGASNVGAQGYPLPPGEPVPVPSGPSGRLTYPLLINGERFPFRSPKARGFTVAAGAARGGGANETEASEAGMRGAGMRDAGAGGRKAPSDGNRAAAPSPAAHDRVAAAISFMEGEAYVERMAYALLRHLGAEPVNGVSCAGGASKNDTWMQIRANVLGLSLRRPAYSGADMGVAMLAASERLGEDLKEVARRFVRYERSFEPDSAATKRYLEGYGRFLEELQKRGYIEDMHPYAQA